MTAYYNEHDRFAAAWLRELIKEGVIAPGVVDERPIQEVKPADVQGFAQCHFFAGIGVWSYALRCAGWPDDRPVWTGSCPCQPFSDAGRKRGFDDERHLWPTWYALIRECGPPAVFGEQVASEDGLLWFDSVFSDLEGEDYAVGAADLCAAGVGAPHIRQRLFFVADTDRQRFDGLTIRVREQGANEDNAEITGRGETGVLADSEGDRWLEGRRRIGPRPGSRDDGSTGIVGDAGRGGGGRDAGAIPRAEGEGEGEGEGIEPRRVVDVAGASGAVVELGDADVTGRTGRTGERGDDGEERATAQRAGGPVGGFWSDAEWIPCRDGKLRPTKPGIFPLAYGIAGRVGQLRGAGNALCAPAAEAFVRAYLEARA